MPYFFTLFSLCINISFNLALFYKKINYLFDNIPKLSAIVFKFANRQRA